MSTRVRSTIRAVALLGAVSVLSLVPVRVATQQVPVFKTGIDLVNFEVTVTDKKGSLVSDLTPGDFEVFEDGKKQDIRLFARGDSADQPKPEMHLGLMLDISESMGEDIAFTKTAAVKFLNTLTDAKDVTVVAFDTEVRAARYSQNEYARLIERIREQKTTSGWTALYDAVGVYLDGAGSQDGRKVMLLYTDGGDNRSSMSLSDLMDLLKASDVTLYAIGELEHQSSSTRNEQRMVLEQMANVTGGKAFFPLSKKQLDDVYDSVIAEIRAQYTLGYLSTNEKTDGAWRKVDIKVVRKGGDYRVRTRKGYYGPYKKADAGNP